MKAKWYKNLRTILKNSEKDADLLRRENFWQVQGMRGKNPSKEEDSGRY
tara:strand:- start:397 stop:543 length:147 start_codon:yes stop_codon:yes gene_type:complete